MNHQESFRALIRAVSMYENDVMRMCDENQFTLEFIQSQGKEGFQDFSPNTHQIIAQPSDSANPNKILMGYRQQQVKQPLKPDSDSDNEGDPHPDEPNTIDVVELVQKIQENSHQTKKQKRKEKNESLEESREEVEDRPITKQKKILSTQKGKKSIKKLRMSHDS
jgi:hypothetical protein